MTFRKLVNLCRLLGSYHYSRLSGVTSLSGLPFSVSIEPTTSCNLRCPQCPSGLRSFTRATGMMDIRVFQKIVDQLSGHLHTLTLYFQGEPFLNRSLAEMAGYASQKGIYTVTSTNGHYLDEQSATAIVESGLDKLIISVDGITQEAYADYRKGGVLAKVLDGTAQVLAQRKRLKQKTPFVVWQCVVFKSNEHEIQLIQKAGRELGVDEVVIKTAQLYDFAEGSAMMPSERHSRYQKNADGSFSIKNSLLNECWRMWQGCVVTWDGKIVPCCFDKDASHTVGDLGEMEFQRIWTSPAYNEFRKAVFSGRKEIDICANCSEGSRVWS
jgi:radical SAM protein with 4Fe4S-binding SPASM domain